MPERVLVLKCESYDSEKVREVVMQGMSILGIKPFGRIFVKPNVVFSHYDKARWGEVAYTHPEFVAGVLQALSKRDLFGWIRRVDVGEKTGIGMPTRMVFRWAGYYEMIKQLRREVNFPLNIFCLEEDRRKEIHIGGKVHSSLRLSRRLINSNYVVSLPKLKLHGLTGVTCAMKLNIGILDDDERSVGHDYRIYEKIVDTVEAVRYLDKPQLIIVDAIKAGVGMEMGSKSRDLGVVIMGTNHLAVDLVAAYLYGLRPPEEKVEYIRAAVRRGFQPTSLDEVEILGDYPGLAGLDLLAERLKPHDDDYHWWQKTEESLRRVKSPIKYYFGPVGKVPQETWCGSCDMALRISFGSIEMMDPKSFSRGRPLSIIVGKHDEIDAEGADVLMVGKCTQVEKLLNAGRVERIDRCFTTVMDLVFDLPDMAGLPNPSLDPRFLCTFVFDTAVSFLKQPQKIILLKLWFVFKRFMRMLKRHAASL